jgi:homoserine dehydrogenase
MLAPESWAIAGAKNVGGELIKMVAKPRVAVDYGLEPYPVAVLDREGWHTGSKEGPVLPGLESDDLPDVDVLFIATPSTENHQPMMRLMGQQLEKGRTVVTCEKGTLAEHYEELTNTPGKLGFWATVGGGIKLSPKLALDAQDPDNIKLLILSTNATLTYASSEVAAGNDRDEVIQTARLLGYSEPEAVAPFDVIHGEAAGDVPRKLAIVWNTIFPHLAELAPSKIETDLTEQDVRQALNQADRYRYLVAIVPEEDDETANEMRNERLGGFDLAHEGWNIFGGMLRVDRTNALNKFQGLTGAGAGYYIALGPQDRSTVDGWNFVSGSGAGGAVTANAMLDNYIALRRQTETA